MKYWIIPSNSLKFDMEASLNANKGIVDWRVKNVEVGDIVFMYKTMPHGCIKYMFEVVEIDIPIQSRLNQDRFWKDMIMYKKRYGKYARLKLVEALDEKKLSIHELRKHGINGNIQSKRSCPAETLKYIMDSLE